MQQMKWLAAALSVVVLAGCNGTSGSGRSVDVDFLWVRTSGSDEVGEGGSTHAILTVEKSDAGMHVGVFESKPGGTGDMWRAAVWVAALTGTLTLKKNPLDYRYSVELEPLTERVDGPSAGGLFAVGIMAAISGQSVNSDYTMTGTINPDGTIGPVGGVPQKLKAAAAKGKTRFCYPAGQRFDTGPDGESIDVEEEARKLNIEAREVEDLSQAYACVTDKKLPKVEPVSRTQMALSAPVFDLLRQQGEKWLGYCQQEYSAAQKLQHPELYQSLWDLASAEYDDAAKLMKEWLVAAGYWKALTAYVWARTVLLCTATAQGLVSDDPTKALDLFNTIQADAQKNMEKMFSWLAQANPDTVNKTISVLDSYEAAISAVVSHEFAKAAYAELMGQVKSAVEAGAP